jgi:hypothetical protein
MRNYFINSNDHFWGNFVTLTLVTCALSDLKTSFRIRFGLQCTQFAPELIFIILQAMQIFHHTLTSSLHIGPCAIYISYICTPFHRMLLRILQNVVGEFSHTVDMSNFKEKHFLMDVLINQLAKMFPTLREIWIFIAILTRHFRDLHADRVKADRSVSAFTSNLHTTLRCTHFPQLVSVFQAVEIRCWIILRCMLCWRIAHSWFYLTVNTKGKYFLKITNLVKFISINLRIQSNTKLELQNLL